MARIDINTVTRENIRNMRPYSSARDEFQGTASVLLDANENPFNSNYNRYPDPHQREIKKKIAGLTGVNDDSIFLGNGSDEAIDLIIRAFCEPGISNIVSIDPSYGMYEVCASVNNIEFRKVSLNPDFSLNPEKLLAATDNNSRVIFLCSPNNPTANLLAYRDMLKVVSEFHGLVVIDEAYIDFAPYGGMLADLENHNNLVILRTFSKAWGMAGIRLGMAFADKEIISILDKIKYPYNINILTQKCILKRLSEKGPAHKVTILVSEREMLINELNKLDLVIKTYPSDANFLLVKFEKPEVVYSYLKDQGIIVRDRSKLNLCKGCLRITVGNPDENKKLINYLKSFK